MTGGHKSGVSPKNYLRNPANRVAVRKSKDKDVTNWSTSAWEFFSSHNTTAREPLTRQDPSDCAAPDPSAFPLLKALESACPVHDTPATGVVVHNIRILLWQRKTPMRSINTAINNF